MGPCLSETELITRFFNFNIPGQWPTQGIGDDCAIIQAGPIRLAITTDTVASGTHFLPDANPYTVGKKALSVNLSDLAAAGAVPRCFFLALSLPQTDPEWLEAFSRGLQEVAETFQCPLLGGDTTKTARIGQAQAPFSITITAIGEVDAYMALMLRTGQWQGCCNDYLARAMDDPTPRVQLGRFLSGCASACADISDGFLKDLGNILSRSGVGAVVNVDSLAQSPELAALPIEKRRQAQLAGGDDYELVWTAPVSAREAIAEYQKAGSELGDALLFSRVGTIVQQGLLLLDKNGSEVSNTYHGFDHFSE